jgi:hypothetical protein
MMDFNKGVTTSRPRSAVLQGENQGQPSALGPKGGPLTSKVCTNSNNWALIMKDASNVDARVMIIYGIENMQES